MNLTLYILIVLASLSPLLTFLRLWQIKEWRVDRLREHLRHEGWFLQLFGWLRPSVVLLGLITLGGTSLVVDSTEGVLPAHMYVLVSVLGLLGWFTLFRSVVGKQAKPVWTRKALAMFFLSLLLLTITCFLLFMLPKALPLAAVLMALPLISFVFVALSWHILSPLDRFLKHRILSRAKALREKYSHLTVVGITGSVGKTTTKELLAHIVSDRKVLVTPAHVNSEMGVAGLMVQKLKGDHQLFIVEMGAYKKGEIELLSTVVQPSIGIITFIGTQHLALFGSREDLCDAKGELFAALPASGHAFLNADSDFVDRLSAKASCPVHTVGTGGHATYEAFDIQETPEGVSFTLRGTQFNVPIQGTHQVVNVLLAVAAAETLGVPPAESAKRLMNFSGVAQTFERKEGKNGQLVLDDTHNASPESFRAAIEWARTSNAEEKILVTSGLLELGEQEKQIYQDMGTLCKGVFHAVIFLNKNCVQYFEHGYGKHVRVVRPQKLRAELREGTLVVCEGRMSERVVERLLA